MVASTRGTASPRKSDKHSSKKRKCGDSEEDDEHIAGALSRGGSAKQADREALGLRSQHEFEELKKQNSVEDARAVSSLTPIAFLTLATMFSRVSLTIVVVSYPVRSAYCDSGPR